MNQKKISEAFCSVWSQKKMSWWFSGVYLGSCSVAVTLAFHSCTFRGLVVYRVPCCVPTDLAVLLAFLTHPRSLPFSSAWLWDSVAGVLMYLPSVPCTFPVVNTGRTSVSGVSPGITPRTFLPCRIWDYNASLGSLIYICLPPFLFISRISFLLVFNNLNRNICSSCLI